MRKAKDSLDTYAERSDDDILAEAEKILQRRFKRQGSVKEPSDAAAYARGKLAKLDHEEFHVMYLDTRHRLIAFDMLFRGSIDGCEVQPREVVREAMRYNSAAVILVHNHPSGNSEPSAADRAVTARLKQALALVDVRVLDHLVVGETVCSMASRGLV